MGRRRPLRAAIECSGSAGWTSGVSADTLTERLSRGSGPFGPWSLKHGWPPAAAFPTVSRTSMLRARKASASASLTTVSPRRSIVVAIPAAVLLLKRFTRSSGVAPATNWPAIEVTFAFTGPATSPGANEAAARPVFIAGLSSTALSPRYSRRWRTTSEEDPRDGRTSTKRKSWALNAGSFIDHSMMRA